MAATYDDSLSTNRDWVRRLIGDTDTSDAAFTDDEIDAIVTERSSNKYLAAALCAEMLLARHQGAIRKRVGNLDIHWSDDEESSYRAYIRWLRKKGAEDLMPTPKPLKLL